MNLFKVCLVEDDNDYAVTLKTYFKKLGDELSATFIITHYSDSTSFLSNYKSQYDLILMDIGLPDVNGIEACKRIRKIDDVVMIVFVTNLAKYAVNGYEVQAFDYIVKPISYYDFAMKMKKALAKINSRQDKEITISLAKGKYSRTKLSQIKYVEVLGHKVIYHVCDEKIESSDTMKHVESALSSFGFSRCNNCYLVNLRYVTGVKGYSVYIKEEELRISEPRKKQFMSDLDKYLGDDTL